jgi:hypothetical protein
MKLTDKAEIAFEKWLNENYKILLDAFPSPHGGNYEVWVNYYFEHLPEAMKYGVYVDWFDNVGIYIEIERYVLSGKNKWGCRIDEKNVHDTRPQARTSAIHKANEKFNNLK